MPVSKGKFYRAVRRFCTTRGEWLDPGTIIRCTGTRDPVFQTETEYNYEVYGTNLEVFSKNTSESIEEHFVEDIHTGLFGLINKVCKRS